MPALTLSGESFVAIVEAVVERLRSDFGASPLLTRAAAAEYLGNEIRLVRIKIDDRSYLMEPAPSD